MAIELLENEQIKQITDYPNYYITSTGRVWSEKSHKWLKPWSNNHSNNPNTARLYVSLGRNTKKLIHRLVAEAFIPNPENLSEVDHINTIASDNRVENLRWVSHQENTKNTLTTEHVSQNGGNFLEVEEIATGKLFKGYKEVAEYKHCCRETIIFHTEGRAKPGYKIYYRLTGRKFNSKGELILDKKD